MAKKLIEVIVTCGRCKEKKSLEFNCELSEEYNHLDLMGYFNLDRCTENYRLWRSHDLPNGVTILCPDCYEKAEEINEDLLDDAKEKVRQFVGGEN